MLEDLKPTPEDLQGSRVDHYKERLSNKTRNICSCRGLGGSRQARICDDCEEIWDHQHQAGRINETKLLQKGPSALQVILSRAKNAQKIKTESNEA